MKKVGDTSSINDDTYTVIAVQLDMINDDFAISYYDNGAVILNYLYWFIWYEIDKHGINDPERNRLCDILTKLLTDMDSQYPYDISMFKR
jgi:hypothetical protein